MPNVLPVLDHFDSSVTGKSFSKFISCMKLRRSDEV